MKNLIFIVQFIAISLTVQAQSVKIYNTETDANAQIEVAIQEAAQSGKHVFIQIGGNWCTWCLKFHDFVANSSSIKDILYENYVVIKVNYSPENKNLPAIKRLEYPQRFGFPVFVILNGKGERIHTQNTAYLEEDKGYSEKKVVEFLKAWTPKAIDAASYPEI
ncbi:MAG: thioredoxin family protein [Tannerella sp.]|jgi:thioredoxin-related protein|nr:thioredoxin family protein [Tannerella sp.]